MGCAEAALARLIVITQDALLLARLVSLSRVKPAKHAKKGRRCMSRMHPRLGEYVVAPVTVKPLLQQRGIGPC